MTVGASSGVSPNVLGRVAGGLARLPAAVRWCGPLIGMSLLWWSSSRQPKPSAPSMVRALLHNGMHVVAYACLAAAFWVALSRAPVEARRWWRTRGAWAFAVLYGAVDELHQSYVPGRTSSVTDLMTDAFGAAFAVVLLRWAVGLSPRGLRHAALLFAGGLASATLATFVDF